MNSSTADPGLRPLAPSGTSRRGRGGGAGRAGAAPAWLLSPATIVIVALIITPIAYLIGVSLTDFDQKALFTGEVQFVGLDQYAAVLQDSQFWWSSGLTICFTVALVSGSMILGVAVAEMMMRLGGSLRLVVTSALVLAWAMPSVAAAQVWNWLFQPGYGVVNWLLTRLGIFGDLTNLSWSNSTGLALLNIWMLVVWQAVPFIAFTTYAARTQVDSSMLEAARIDGAGEMRVFFTIVLDSLKPTLLLITILSIIWDFNVFNQIWLITQGGPDNSTATLGVWTYLTAFNTFQVGSGSAIAVITTVMLLILSGFYIRSLLRSGEDL